MCVRACVRACMNDDKQKEIAGTGDMNCGAVDTKKKGT